MSIPVKVLSAKHLGKHVLSSDGSLTILHDISFDVCEGESVAITGASGSGKSTLLGLLAGLDAPTSGHVELASHNLSQLDEDGRAKLRGQKVGFVFQSFQLLPHLTALENVMLPAELNGLASPKENAQICLEQVGLADRANHFPKTLSGGEQQRVALARAFIMKPEILFAADTDQPRSGHG
jgi:putative ABC transport system ATP-binding protein